MLVLSVTGTRQQTHRLAAASPASTRTALARLAACPWQPQQSHSQAHDVQVGDELQVGLFRSSRARLRGKHGCNQTLSHHSTSLKSLLLNCAMSTAFSPLEQSMI